jgi:beta-galactosidase
MKLTLTTLALLLGTTHAMAQTEGRITTAFDPGWRFLKADAKDAHKPAFNDAKWRQLAVPHDWSIEGPYDQSNPTARGGGYLPAGIGWYRKKFTLPATEAKRLVRIEFDGVMANSEVWVNGVSLGKRPYGYSSFSYELSKHLKYGKGQSNVIAVRADNSVQPASRYYTGAGIYRHVRLVSTEPVHFGEAGVFVSAPTATAQQASLRIASDLRNASAANGEFQLETTVFDPAGKKVQVLESKQALAAGAAAEVVQTLDVANPQRWSLDKPQQYKAVSVLRKGAAVLDTVTTNFGIREAKFEAATGFWLNGVNVKIKGVCLHHDAGALGAAVPLAAWERRFELLREVGVNAIRTSHNPVAPEFLDLADRMGFLVMNESFDTWTAAKHNGEQGYNRFFTDWWETDTRAMLLRDRNHPSIILYSVGNEIHDNLNEPEGFRKYKMQQDLVHKLDPTRPVTMALFRPHLSKVYENGFAETMDIVGQNYRENELVAAHKANPKRIVIGTENNHALSAWHAMRDNAFFTGQFLWVGFDYLGESDWPSTTFDQGLFDRAGNIKPRGSQRQSWWSDKPMVRLVRKQDNGGVGNLVADWTPTDFDTYDDAKVEAYSNAEEVELYLNGKSLGAKAKPADDSPRKWDVTFAPGLLRAVARNKGKEVAQHELRSAAAPARIELTTSRNAIGATFDDAAYVTARIVDANGVTNPNGASELTFSVAGPGAVVAVDNGSVTSHAPYQTNKCKTDRGQCVAVVKANAAGGNITVTASAPGLTAGTALIAAGSTRYTFNGKDSFFTAPLPEGNYKVTLTLGDPKAPSNTTVKAELRRLMLENVAVPAGQTAERSFYVNVRTAKIAPNNGVAAGEVKLKAPRETVTEARAWDQGLTLEFGGKNPAVRTIEITPVQVPTLFLLGDSTVSDQPGEPYSSWGQMLPRFMKPGIAVANHAQSGETYRDSIARRRLDKVVSALKPGDTVIMQFGHNDQKQIKEGKGGPFTTYKDEIRTHVNAIRAAGGVPVLVSSMERRNFDAGGKVVGSLKDYAEATRQMADEMKVAYIDLNEQSKHFYEALGPDESKKAFAEPSPGKIDNTHHNNYGAYELAQAIATGLRQASVPVAAYVEDMYAMYDPTKPDAVATFAVPASVAYNAERPLGDEANK